MKIHLGCGERHIPGFLHIDALNVPRVDVVCLAERLPFADGSVSMIYASHVLEHFDRHVYRDVLAEWRRVLMPEGILRLAVPDFAACAAIYYECGLEDGLSGLIGLIVGGQRNEYDYHKMVFDEEYLRNDLLAQGFRDVRRWNWRATEHGAIDDFSQAYIPHMRKEDGRLMSLNLEAVK
jgi:predicted SAM-dependent methyltransferase